MAQRLKREDIKWERDSPEHKRPFEDLVKRENDDGTGSDRVTEATSIGTKDPEIKRLNALLKQIHNQTISLAKAIQIPINSPTIEEIPTFIQSVTNYCKSHNAQYDNSHTIRDENSAETVISSDSESKTQHGNADREYIEISSTDEDMDTHQELPLSDSREEPSDSDIPTHTSGCSPRRHTKAQISESKTQHGNADREYIELSSTDEDMNTHQELPLSDSGEEPSDSDIPTHTSGGTPRRHTKAQIRPWPGRLAGKTTPKKPKSHGLIQYQERTSLSPESEE